jgi:hypothetical protein
MLKEGPTLYNIRGSALLLFQDTSMPLNLLGFFTPQPEEPPEEQTHEEWVADQVRRAQEIISQRLQRFVGQPMTRETQEVILSEIGRWVTTLRDDGFLPHTADPDVEFVGDEVRLSFMTQPPAPLQINFQGEAVPRTIHAPALPNTLENLWAQDITDYQSSQIVIRDGTRSINLEGLNEVYQRLSPEDQRRVATLILGITPAPTAAPERDTTDDFIPKRKLEID